MGFLRALQQELVLLLREDPAAMGECMFLCRVSVALSALTRCSCRMTKRLLLPSRPLPPLSPPPACPESHVHLI